MKKILFVDWETAYRKNIVVQIEHRYLKDGIEILHFTTPDEAKSGISAISGQLGLLVTHAHFWDEHGERDYGAAADLCNFVRSRWPTVPILALTSSVSSIAFGDYGFPEDIVHSDIHFSPSSDVVQMIVDLLKYGTPQHA